VTGRQEELGVAAAGQLVDLTLLDLATPAFTPLNDPAQHLVYSDNGSSVRSVIVNGQGVMDDGKVLTIDEQAVLDEAREARERRKPLIPPISPEARNFLQAQERLTNKRWRLILRWIATRAAADRGSRSR
jgi:hypothetical protein